MFPFRAAKASLIVAHILPRVSDTRFSSDYKIQVFYQPKHSFAYIASLLELVGNMIYENILVIRMMRNFVHIGICE